MPHCFAAEILATSDAALYERLAAWRAARTKEVLDQTLIRPGTVRSYPG